MATAGRRRWPEAPTSNLATALPGAYALAADSGRPGTVEAGTLRFLR